MVRFSLTGAQGGGCAVVEECRRGVHPVEGGGASARSARLVRNGMPPLGGHVALSPKPGARKAVG